MMMQHNAWEGSALSTLGDAGVFSNKYCRRMLQHSQQVLGVPVLVQDTALTESGHGLHSHSVTRQTGLLYRYSAVDWTTLTPPQTPPVTGTVWYLSTLSKFQWWKQFGKLNWKQLKLEYFSDGALWIQCSRILISALLCVYLVIIADQYFSFKSKCLFR